MEGGRFGSSVIAFFVFFVAIAFSLGESLAEFAAEAEHGEGGFEPEAQEAVF